MVDVTHGAHIDVGLIALELGLGHFASSSSVLLLWIFCSGDWSGLWSLF